MVKGSHIAAYQDIELNQDPVICRLTAHRLTEAYFFMQRIIVTPYRARLLRGIELLGISAHIDL